MTPSAEHAVSTPCSMELTDPVHGMPEGWEAFYGYGNYEACYNSRASADAPAPMDTLAGMGKMMKICRSCSMTISGLKQLHLLSAI